MVMSAVSSVSTPGVLVTMMPRLARGRDVDIVHPGAEIGDQLQVRAGLGDQAGIDMVGDGGNQHSAVAMASASCAPGHGRVVQVQAGVEQLAHPRFHLFRQLAGDDHQGLLGASWRH